MGRIRDRLYIPAKAFATIEDAAGFGAGNPVISRVTSRDIVGFQMDVAGDIATGALKVPIFFDPEHTLGIKVHWTSGSSTAADTIDWIFKRNFVIEDAQIPTLISTDLDTLISQDTVGVATTFINKWTARGLINANWLTRTQIEAGAIMVFSVEMDASAIDLAVEKVWLLGIELDFVRRDFVGTKDVDQPLSSL